LPPSTPANGRGGTKPGALNKLLLIGAPLCRDLVAVLLACGWTPMQAFGDAAVVAGGWSSCARRPQQRSKYRIQKGDLIFTWRYDSRCIRC